MLMVLSLNEIRVDYTQRELIDLGLSIADGSMDYDDILNWIMQHKAINSCAGEESNKDK